jgi:hyperosmotically inducible periplasmic protein
MLRRTMLAVTIVVLGVVPAVTRAADQSATDKVKDTATSATDKAKDIATSAGKELSDSWITLKTKIALLADEKVSSTDVHVTTKAGVITLRGKVATEEARQAAEVDALKIEGAKKVVNYLVVVPKAAQKMVERKDDQIVKDVDNRLKKDSSLKKASIDVHSDNGIITLTGDVPSLETSLRASENARQVAGVRAVRNELTVENEEKQR